MASQRVWITHKPPEHIPSPPHGSEKGLEDDDPYALHGVRFPVAEGVDADREVALAQVEEFALSGWRREHIKTMFEAPTSGSLYDIYRRRGDELVEELLSGVFGHPTNGDGNHDG